MILVTASEMQAMDRRTIEAGGIPGIELMEKAGCGATEFLLDFFPQATQCRIGIMAGKGNNGGDGFVIARCLSQKGIQVSVYLLAKSSVVKGDAAENLKLLAPLKIPVIEIPDEKSFSDQKRNMQHFDLWVDAILGTGLQSDVRGFYREAIEFINSLKAILTPGGFVVFEVPDCENSLATRHYTSLWEEHILYFTPPTFKQSLALLNFDLVYFENVYYALENALIGIARIKEAENSPGKPFDSRSTHIHCALKYADAYDDQRTAYHRYFEAYISRKGNIALFGAGHFACTFVNFFDLKDYMAFVVDDNPHKQGYYMPGSKLPICGSEALQNADIKLCLLCLNPEIENKVVNANRNFVENGGAFASIFPGSDLALTISED